jgi:hypothetical protein
MVWLGWMLKRKIATQTLFTGLWYFRVLSREFNTLRPERFQERLLTVPNWRNHNYSCGQRWVAPWNHCQFVHQRFTLTSPGARMH